MGRSCQLLLADEVAAEALRQVLLDRAGGHAHPEGVDLGLAFAMPMSLDEEGRDDYADLGYTTRSVVVFPLPHTDYEVAFEQVGRAVRAIADAFSGDLTLLYEYDEEIARRRDGVLTIDERWSDVRDGLNRAA